ncbi:isoaspartyl peptidase/L-asparaginase [Halorussus marinus]|uniref:isoaspartyl peptidase/L-asparaginase n=1 Tax=Halorussus marinus TaxID=2505976 RepID=UPI0010928F4A|nr:isoaspartyl peptidase/L-asparaginase [Halorussus marinus]
MKVIVHGGAGDTPDEPEPRQQVLNDAAATGAEASSVVDAVESAVRVLESSPRFNAGVGGAVQSDGEVRTDAGVMTDDRRAGAACSMPGVEHAVSAARVVLEETPHVLVSGDRAVDLAADFGVETGVDLWTESSRERWEGYDTPEGSPSEHLEWLREKFGGADTVGAVATDGEAFAAATSTGGRWLALAGRVGDVPQIGSGFFAAPAGAASATGAGEDIAKATLTRRAVRHLESGLGAQRAADRAIEEFAELTGASAGVIVLDADGEAGSAFNSDGMQTAVHSGD